MALKNPIRETIFAKTKAIIDKHGPRLAGYTASQNAAEDLYQSADFADKREIEEFSVHSGAFMGWIRILVVCYLGAAILLWFGLPWISVILVLISLAILVFQFFLYYHFIDFLYPKRKGRNVIASVLPKGEVKKRIIVSGHHDSAHVFNFFIHQPKLYNLRVTGGIALILFLLVVSIVAWVFPGFILNLPLRILASAGFILTGQMWFFSGKNGTPGAGDNLVSSVMAFEIARFFKTNPLENTEVIALSFDAEEEGLRGARAYANKHAEDFQNVETILLNVDCPYELKELFFLTSDINGSVAMSEELAKELVEIAHQKNYPAVHKQIAFLTGGTDAGELAKKGVKATTLMAMPWDNNSRAAVYHTPNDTAENIDPKAIDAAVDIFIEYIRREDKKERE